MGTEKKGGGGGIDRAMKSVEQRGREAERVNQIGLDNRYSFGQLERIRLERQRQTERTTRG